MNEPTLREGAPIIPVAPTAAPLREDPTTLEPTDVSRLASGLVDPDDVAALEDATFDARYQDRALLGQGGMGEVRLCRDALIGRDVAMKLVRGGTGSHHGSTKRFVREARIQGQLEHPAIVPVYDLGLAPSGETFFTMKRVRGQTLAEIVEKLFRGDDATAAQFSTRKLLTAFSSVCLAVDFAHDRGVVHRDLKPANVMFGDFGEVYVLDWGLAKLRQDKELSSGDSVDAPLETAVRTLQGALMGTPGYMAPEQIRGELELVDARTDVFALGAILFELLSHEPLYRRTDPLSMMAATLAGADARPSARAEGHGIAPELDAICVRATALEPKERFESARALGAAIERFLDGDRDLALRRQLAEEHAAVAETHAREALAHDSDGSLRARAEALRAVGGALALDPGNERAMRTMVSLLVEPPREIPEEARAELEAEARRQTQFGARSGGVGYLAVVLFIPLLFWMGIRDWSAAALCFSFAGAAIGASLLLSRAEQRSLRIQALLIILSTTAVAAGSRMFGAFVLLPSFAVINTLGFIIWPTGGRRVTFVLAGCLAISAPLLLEWAGVWPASYVFEGGRMILVPQMLGLEETPTMIFLLVTNLALLIGGSWAIGRVRDSLTAAEERLQRSTWQLRQLLPTEIAQRPAAGDRPAP